ncbi:hypothetical protein T484DRAFT_1855458 [Baffinella frigidus]|nr:hypothetical protein T484DRAFT_1855458 [Cryptophyta sp. CCMP2293]
MLNRNLYRESRRHKHSWPFLKPVDPIREGVPNYLEVVNTPDGLGHSNAMEFNPQGHWAYDQAMCV